MAEQEVGPFYVADELVRSAVAEDKAGLPLSLRIGVLDARSCAPLANAAIDLWHCDAMGLYSGYTTSNLGPPPGGRGGPGGPGGVRGGPPPDFGPNGPGGPPPGPPPGGPGGGGPGMGMSPTDKLTFLRGIQITDSSGVVGFQTVFPGFYQGRVNHIHFKVRIGGHAEQKTYAAGHVSHTGQLFFPEELAVKLMAMEPYASHHIHRTTQAEDGVFNRQHGDMVIARIKQVRPDDVTAGFHAELTVAVDPTATPAGVGVGGGPPGRGRG